MRELSLLARSVCSRALSHASACSFLNDCEYWEYERGFDVLNLTRAKVGGLRIARGHSKMHSHFASGTSGENSAIAQNLWARLRKKRKLGENVMVMNKLLYGASYAAEDDAALDAAMRELDDGPCVPSR